MPIGVLEVGPAIEAFGLRPTLLATGALYAGVVVAAMFLPALRGMDERRTAAKPTDAAHGREIAAATHSG